MFVGVPEPTTGREPTILATGAKGVDDADGTAEAEALRISGTAGVLPLMPGMAVIEAERLPRPGRAGLRGKGSGKALLKMADGVANRDVAGPAV